MEAPQAMSLPPRELVRIAWTGRWRVLKITLVCGALAAAYSLIMPRYWDASQGLVVRQETAGGLASKPGKFADLFEMRTLQETILELAKSQQVVVATLKAVDGPQSQPSLEDIEQFRKHLKMLPPDGGEFGKTEVFYFTLKAKSRERAIQLVGELCRQLEVALKELRTHRAASLIAELQEQSNLASQTLAVETKRLMEFETQVGADLGELRMLHSANSGQSDLRMESVQLEADVRKFLTQVREGQKLIALLVAAEDDPRQLIATPNSLLAAQPALRRLKDGLVDAQLATSRLGGTRSPDHPRVRAAVEAEAQIRKDLHDELVTAIRGAEVELQLSGDRLAAAQERLGDLQARFTLLAEQRAEYSNRVAAVDNCRQTLDRARENLSTAKAAHAAAQSGSLVTRLDDPETGPYPAGPGRTVITGAGAMAGLMLALGFVFLTATAPASVEAIVPRTARARTPAVDAVTRATPHNDPRWLAASHAAPDPAKVIEQVAASAAPAPVAAPATSAAPLAAPARSVRDSTPVAAIVPGDAPVSVPPAPAALAPRGTAAAYRGMSLQEALQAAAQMST